MEQQLTGRRRSAAKAVASRFGAPTHKFVFASRGASFKKLGLVKGQSIRLIIVGGSVCGQAIDRAAASAAPELPTRIIDSPDTGETVELIHARLAGAGPSARLESRDVVNSR